MRIAVWLIMLAACEKASHESDKPRDEKPAVTDTASPAASRPAPPKASSTGAAECDELIELTQCSYDKAGAGIPADVRKVFDDSVAVWTEALHHDVTRQATIDACKMSLDAARDGFAAQGCVSSGATHPERIDFIALRDGTMSTGAAVCDELILRTVCSYDKAGAAMPVEARRAFEDSINMWADALKNDATRQPTLDACKVSLEAAMSGFAAQGCGDPDFRHLPATGGVAVAPDPAPVVIDLAPTGDPTCDELVKRTKCAYEKAGAAMPAEAGKAFNDSLGAWREALDNDATRQATIDACKMSLDAANDGFTAQGC